MLDISSPLHRQAVHHIRVRLHLLRLVLTRVLPHLDGHLDVHADVDVDAHAVADRMKKMMIVMHSVS